MVFSRLIVRLSLAVIAVCIMLSAGFSAIGRFVPEGWQITYSELVAPAPLARWRVNRHDIDRNLAYPIYTNPPYASTFYFSTWDSPLSLSPDDRYIVQSVIATTGRPVTYLIDVHKDESYPLFESTVNRAVWSSDGRYLAYTTIEGFIGVFVVIDRVDALSHIALGDIQFGVGVDWSADGDLVFSGYQGRFSAENDIDLYTYSLAEGVAHNITNSVETSEYAPIWSPDGSQVAYIAQLDSGVFNPYRIELANGQIHPLATTASREVSLIWSPDGAYLLYQVLSNGQIDLYLSPVEGTRSDFQLLATNILNTGTQWSPDGGQVVVNRLVNGQILVYVVDVADGTISPITRETAVLLP